MFEKIKRYKFEQEYDRGQSIIPIHGDQHPYGAYVRYEDHLKIVKELENELDIANDTIDQILNI